MHYMISMFQRAILILGMYVQAYLLLFHSKNVGLDVIITRQLFIKLYFCTEAQVPYFCTYDVVKLMLGFYVAEIFLLD